MTLETTTPMDDDRQPLVCRLWLNAPSQGDARSFMVRANPWDHAPDTPPLGLKRYGNLLIEQRKNRLSPLQGRSNSIRRRMSRTLFRAAGRRAETDSLSVGALISGLGDRSFGWSILLFSLVNLIPMPIGSNMITSLPLILLTGQMAAGFDHVRLPTFITRREVNRRGFQRVVLQLKPLIRGIEKIVRTRHVWLFQPKNERMIGFLLLAVSLALFLPIPLSGFIPATALFITAFGLIERDGLVTFSGLTLGIISILITLIVGGMLWMGVDALAQ